MAASRKPFIPFLRWSGEWSVEERNLRFQDRDSYR